MGRKIVTYMLIAIILINSIYPNIVYAVDIESVLPSNDEMNEYGKNHGDDAVDNAFDNATANVKSDNKAERKEELRIGKTSSSKVSQVLADFFNIFPALVNFGMTFVIKNFQKKIKTEETEPVYSNGVVVAERTVWEEIKYFTIEDILFNRYYLFDVDFFNFSSQSNNDTLITIKKNVASWYYSLRNIAIVANLIILIYLGIRIALSTIAEEEAKYKKMVFAWGTSILIIFFMHYIISFLYVLQHWAIDFLRPFIKGNSFEKVIMDNIWSASNNALGLDTVSFVITIYVLVYYELKFFIMYFKRFITVGFLITISPLITISYAIDAAGDGKTQIFNTWLKEMVFNIFIQVIHAIIYIIFVISAAEIAKEIPIMGAVLFASLSRAVKVIQTSLHLNSSFTKSKSLLKMFKK